MFSQNYFVVLILSIYLSLIIWFFFQEQTHSYAYHSKFDDCSYSRPCISLCSNKNEFSDEDIKANITNFVKFRESYYEDEEDEKIDNFTIHWTQLTCKHFDLKNIKNDYKLLNVSYVS